MILGKNSKRNFNQNFITKIHKKYQKSNKDGKYNN